MDPRIDDCYREGRFGDLAFLYAPIGLVVTENRVIRDCNHAFAEIFGYARVDIRNRVFSILYPTDAEFDNIRDRGMSQLRETYTYWDERIMARKDGSLFWCRVRGHSVSPEEPFKRAVRSFADLSGIRPYLDLKQREREIVSHLADGLNSKEIALKLEIWHRSVEVYRTKLLKNFGVTDTSALFQALGGGRTEHIVPHE